MSVRTSSWIALFCLTGVGFGIAFMTGAFSNDPVIIQEEEPRCNFDNEFYSSYNDGCMPNSLHTIFYNSLGFEDIDTKQIVGRIVQIESGDHITLESGERYAISNGIDDIWIDDLVTLHKIEHRAIECEIALMNFYNGTTIASDVFNFRNPDIVMTKQELQDHFNDYKKLVDKKYGQGLFEYKVVRQYEERQCEKDYRWEIEKIE